MGRARQWLATLLTFGLAAGAMVVLPTTANANGGGGGAGDPGSSCDVYPIAVKSSVVGERHQGKVIEDLTSGAPSGHEGWLTWTGDVGEPALAKSLTPPGDSERYVNPDDATDRVLSVGDWVTGPAGRGVEPGVSRGARQAGWQAHRRAGVGLDPWLGRQRRVSRERVRQRGDHVVPACSSTTGSPPSTSVRRRARRRRTAPVAQPTSATTPRTSR